MSHLCQVHRSEKSKVKFSCPVSRCSAVYSKVNSLCSHVYRIHRDDLRSTSSVIPAAREQEPSLLDGSSDFSLPSSVSHDVDQLLHRDVHEQKKRSSLFLLHLREERLLTQVAINDVLAGCRELFNHTVCRLQAGVSQKLALSGIDMNDISGLDQVFSDVSDPFAGLETAYLQSKFVSQELGCIVRNNYYCALYLITAS